MRKVRIFLSYVHSDKADILSLYHRLEKAGTEPWMDTKGILGGQKWEEIILKAIEVADFFLACLTEKSVKKRGFLQKELRKAYERHERLLPKDVFLIPVKLDDCEVPEWLTPYQWIDLQERQGWKKLLTAIDQEIDNRLKGKVRPIIPRPAPKRSSVSTTAKGKAINVIPSSNSNVKITRRRKDKKARSLLETQARVLTMSEIPHLASEITRAALPREWLHDLGIARRVINRIREVNAPRMVLFSSKSPQTPHIKIASISTNLEIAQLARVEKHNYVLWRVQSQYLKQLRQEFLHHLAQAGEAGANLVCLNELAYPTPLDTKGEKAFEKEVKKIVAHNQLALIAGSYHDPVEFYNLAPVIVHSNSLGGPHTIKHAKMTTAGRAFELIRIPRARNLRYYQTVHGTFAILIGSDVFDPSLTLRLILKNHLYSGEEKIDFVFVPSFTANDGPKLAKACQDLSYASAALVVYVNCSADIPRHAAFLGGEELANRNAAIKCGVTSISPNLVLYDVPFDEYQRIRSKVSDSYSPIANYLTGMKDGIRIDVKW